MNETARQWIFDNYDTVDWYREVFEPTYGEGYGDCITWPSRADIYTPVGAFLEMFGEAIEQALAEGKDDVWIKQAIRDIDPENNRGYNNLL
ncbi:hypothetical protein HMSSN139_13940 [Paenibacillus sp. HMSSN-139]|nr:hypothetical protein HMSSN139_13940 [Paenibacillus sp. HMSSN-139]